MSIFHANTSGFHAANAPGSRSQQEHITRETLDGEVFVERADNRFFRLGDDEVICILGNGATRCDRGEPRSSSAADNIVDLVAVKKGATAPALRSDAFREHFNDGVEISSREIAVRVCVAN